ncbi:DUF3224 domain-containing protein [Brevundimonas sp.]|uniref:DUF3224 domain-containing protein n=1 Tax=Brevundimonas sp. TaxID=1871086 RepID=UPI0028ABE254|nr:DUF3224 domain-containing protein [Brevundimonas sp.]
MSEGLVMKNARGTFEVVITPVQPAEGAASDAPGRMLLAKTFHGDLTGTASGEMLATMSPERSGAYVAIDRVHGAIDGREGAFTLVHRGLMDRGAQELLITIVPGSGAGKLTGIAGVFHLAIVDGVHNYDLEYSLPTS